MPISRSRIDTLSNELFDKINGYLTGNDLEKVKEAYDFAKHAHQGQLRKSGEPYIIHPLRTAKILTNFRVDEETIAAALLHDVLEDTEITIKEIEKKFGKKIGYLVDGITKLSKVYYREKMQQRQIESLKKLFFHSARDLRVILIKLADRLDNMRTLRFIANEKKRTRIARETLEIYVPIANLLGIGEIRAELEDLCFEYLQPVDYQNLKCEVDSIMEERGFVLDEMIHITNKELHKNNIEAEIVGRRKTLYSIYKKMKTKDNVNSIDDLIAIRVIVPTRKECYDILGILHRLFKPKNGTIKDYIAVPKPNGYQSLHTTVFGLNSTVVEFQIRTRYMHLEAEFGVAAHYFYKYSDEKELASIMRQRSSWVQRILDMQKDQEDPEHFLENLKLDIFQDRIFLFSPKGDVIDLPIGASALDFAYAIHTDLGNHAYECEINGTIQPISAALTTGDTVKIFTKKEVNPEREWLNYTKTSLATTKIKEYLKREPPDQKYLTGKKFLQREFDYIGKDSMTELNSKCLKLISEKTKYKNLDSLLIAIGAGEVNPQSIIEIIYGKEHLKPSGIVNSPFFSHVGLRVLGDNSKNQFREIIRTLSALKIPITKFVIDKPLILNLDRCRMTILVKNYNELSQIFESLEHIDGVEKVSRSFIYKKIKFFVAGGFTALLWITHPFMIDKLLSQSDYGRVISNLLMYGGLLMLVALVFYLKGMIKRSLPELAETNYYWSYLYGITTLAMFVTFMEITAFRLQFNWVFIILLIVGIYALLTTSYIRYKKGNF